MKTRSRLFRLNGYKVSPRKLMQKKLRKKGHLNKLVEGESFVNRHKIFRMVAGGLHHQLAY